ncbi:MAG: YHS domain-containing protein [Blastocatellia bacterium]|nr:YHS domain-containing protein [Blastocatellia bacterium]
MRKLTIALFIVFASVAVMKASDDDKKAVTNKKCPVMKNDVSEKQRVEYKGQYVYFCCQMCPATFEKDPEKYIATLSKEDQEAVKANEVCPMTKEPVDQSKSIEYEGRKVYFCCEGCAEAYKEKMAAKKSN